MINLIFDAKLINFYLGMVLFSQFHNGGNKKGGVLFYRSIDEFQTINESLITLSIIVLKHCTIQVLLFNAT